MAGESYDGHPTQAGAATGLTGVMAGFSLAGLTVAVVVARYPVDAPGNRRRTGNEYDLREVHTGQLIKGAVLLQRVSGYQNGEDVLLHPASTNLKGDPLSSGSPARDTDGDVVVVGYILGSRERPVILGTLPHGSSTYAAKARDGERRYFQHAGVTVSISPDGQVDVHRDPTIVQISPAGNVHVVAPKDVSFIVDIPPRAPGQVPRFDPNIVLGFAEHTHPAVRGDDLREAFNALVAKHNLLVTLFLAHIHTLGVIPTSQPGTVPAPSAPSGGGSSPIGLDPSAAELPLSALSDVVGVA